MNDGRYHATICIPSACAASTKRATRYGRHDVLAHLVVRRLEEERRARRAPPSRDRGLGMREDAAGRRGRPTSRAPCTRRGRGRPRRVPSRAARAHERDCEQRGDAPDPADILATHRRLAHALGALPVRRDAEAQVADERGDRRPRDEEVVVGDARRRGSARAGGRARRARATRAVPRARRGRRARAPASAMLVASSTTCRRPLA